MDILEQKWVLGHLWTCSKQIGEYGIFLSSRSGEFYAAPKYIYFPLAASWAPLRCTLNPTGFKYQIDTKYDNILQSSQSVEFIGHVFILSEEFVKMSVRHKVWHYIRILWAEKLNCNSWKNKWQTECISQNIWYIALLNII